MALSPEQLAQLRRMIDEPNDSNGWTDTALNLLASQHLRTDGTYDMNGMAGAGWTQKAARYVELVAMAEAGSSRSLNQMFDHALAMAKQYASAGTEVTDPTPSPRSTRVVRATRGG